jgi:ABC-2 type transport system ATP-binding protein
MSDTAVLELKGVEKRYGKHLAVDGLHIALHPGDFLGLIGPNGAGKSTTLRMAVGHLKPGAGQVLLRGRDIHKDPLEARRSIGYVPEFLSLYEYLTGEEYLEFVGELKGLEPSRLRAELPAILDVLDLGDERSRLIRTYSQGMRRKIALGAAILNRPPVLILDEALNGLDPTTLHRLKGYLKTLADDGMAILLSSHVLEVLERLCNRTVVMRAGRCVDVRNASELEQIRSRPGGLEAHFMSVMGLSAGGAGQEAAGVASAQSEGESR